MAYKEVTRVEIKEVIRRWQDGTSVRKLAKGMGVSRKTVVKYIRAAEACGLTRDGPLPTEEQLTRLMTLNVSGPRQAERPSQEKLEPWTERIETWIEKDKLILTRVHELLTQQGCDVSYTSLRRFVFRKGWTGRKRTTVRMAETSPGEVTEMDFGWLGMIWDEETGRKKKVWALVLTLKYSRHCFVWPMFTQKLEEVVEGFERAWAFFGGIPLYVVIDNFPGAVAGPDSLNPQFTRGFLEYSQYRGFIPDPARCARPQDKPQVERGIPYVRERFFKGGQFRDLPDLRTQAREWCMQVAGHRVHGTTMKLPLVVFEQEEQPCLLPWDGEPYDMPCWQPAKVHKDHHISCGRALYSVPYSVCPPGEKVEVRRDSKLVRVYYRGNIIKVHPKQPYGGRSTDPDDYPPEKTEYTMRNPNYLCRRCAELGPSIGAFAERLFEGPVPWARIRQGMKLVRLADRYTPELLESACEKALSVDLINVYRVENMLKKALESEAPLGERRSLELPGRFARPGEVFARKETKL